MLKLFLVAGYIFIVLLAYSLCRVSSECSRQEEAEELKRMMEIEKQSEQTKVENLT